MNFVKFSIEPVGQGLFYTGKIGSLNLVYDCGNIGNLNVLKNAIDNYINSLEGTKTIDMLVISHLHVDHVRGLDYLLNSRKPKVRYVFLPYLLPVQRLLIALANIKYLNRNYLELLEDPINYFIKRGVEKVVIIGGGEGEYDEVGRPPSSDAPEPENEFHINSEDLDDNSFNGLPEDSNLNRIITDLEKDLDRNVFKKLVMVKNHSGYISLNAKWLFRFFNSTINNELLCSFISCVSNILGSSSQIDSKMLKKILKDKNSMNKLKQCYTKNFKDLNNTSLLLYHGPVRSINSNFGKIIIRKVEGLSFRPPYFYLIHIDGKFGWLLSGDKNFNKNFDQFKRHYRNELANMNHLLVPHHGSRQNWNSELLELIKNPSYWFVSSGLGNKFGHPSFQVVKDILVNGNKIYLSNEIFKISEEIYK